MKAKVIFLSGALMCSAVMAAGQLKVESSGDVKTDKNLTVGGTLGVSGNLTLDRGLTVNGEITTKKGISMSDGYMYIKGIWHHGSLSLSSSSLSLHTYDRYGGLSVNVMGGYDPAYTTNTEIIAIRGRATGEGTEDHRNIGVYGDAINLFDTEEYNYGVLGVVKPQCRSVAIAGFVRGAKNYTNILPNGGVYAGYFVGDVKVDGALSTTVTTSSSDERLKRNMLSLGRSRVLDKLMLLKPIAYNFKQVETEVDSLNSKGEKVKYVVKRYDEKAQEFQKKHYGLNAQDLQKVYPDLVYEDGDGYLSINYTGLIPLLLQAIQEQQVVIEQLQKRLPDYGITSSKTASVESEQLTNIKEE